MRGIFWSALLASVAFAASSDPLQVSKRPPEGAKLLALNLKLSWKTLKSAMHWIL